MLEDLDLHSIADEQARELVRQLLNLLEDVRADLRAAQAENQRLRDEINRLKGEQGMPTIKANTPQPPPKDHSSERERRTPKTWSKGHKTAGLAVDREQVVSVDPARLPPDAEFKGYEDGDRLTLQLIELTIFAPTLLGPSEGAATNLSWATSTQADCKGSSLCACPREKYDHSNISA
jgi:hypothetical protein